MLLRRRRTKNYWISGGPEFFLRRRRALKPSSKALIPPGSQRRQERHSEIRAGTGGSEAALFAGDLFRMYGRCRKQGLEDGNPHVQPHRPRRFQEVIFAVGRRRYRRLKYERCHRVQRIPLTESGGRIHTSTATVAVLPESEEIDEMSIDPDELRIDTYCRQARAGRRQHHLFRSANNSLAFGNSGDMPG